jgi:hypothetical protein
MGPISIFPPPPFDLPHFSNQLLKLKLLGFQLVYEIWVESFEIKRDSIEFQNWNPNNNQVGTRDLLIVKIQFV